MSGPAVRLLSRARGVGRIDPPVGQTWEALLARPGGEHLAILDFHALAARLLGVSAGRVHVQRKLGTETRPSARRKPGHWHRDSYGQDFLMCVLGERPTEFLLGEYAQELFLDESRHAELEAGMRRFQPAPGELVLADNATIHRRPQLGEGRRLFLIASVDESAGSRARGSGRE